MRLLWEWSRAASGGTGALGLFTLALRPLVYAVGVIPPAGGAAAIALFGVGWVALGLRGGRPAT